MSVCLGGRGDSDMHGIPPPGPEQDDIFWVLLPEPPPVFVVSPGTDHARRPHGPGSPTNRSVALLCQPDCLRHRLPFTANMTLNAVGSNMRTTNHPFDQSERLTLNSTGA
ncbi:unnamed protein product [Protopolystoma xenopodis]|uniref:Uncharacterized protein n=1 Tax=Protopolystoma xenopodis TaxID=117903 RepID=A0A448WQG8_9PLAT|nr:unnamed protein product [Protopolystoma xenopodis]